MNRQNNFFIVGIGASTGGLEALQTLFENMPENTGMAFVIVLHSTSNDKTKIGKLLSKCTKMPVLLANEKVKLKPNCIYLNRNDKNIILEKDAFKYVEIIKDQPKNLPVDLFFHSLGNTLEEYAIGIILSGIGTDGSGGIATIKGAGGTVIAQNPDSARFDGMPSAAIKSGFVDFIAAPDEVGAFIKRITSDLFPGKNNIEINKKEEEFLNILELLTLYSGIDFSVYKNSTLLRRIDKNMAIRQLKNYREYTGFIESNNGEKDLLVREFLIGVTRFFRDIEAFESLKKTVIPDLFQKKTKENTPVRIWVTACSTGEEAYSIAMVIDDYLKENELDTDFRIFATDVGKTSIQVGSKGKYPVNCLLDIPGKYLDRYFIKKEDSIEIVKRIREKIVFSTHNLLRDPPFIKMDLISCRNFLIYLEPAAQQKVIHSFLFGLNMGGYLFLGHSETAGELQKMFKTVDAQWRIFKNITYYHELSSQRKKDLRKKKDTFTNEKIGFEKKPLQQITNSEKFFTDIIADNYGPPSVFVNSSMEILYVNGNINDYVKFPSGLPNNNFLDILEDGNMKAITQNGIRRAIKEDKKIIFKNIPFTKNNKKNTATLTFQKFESQSINDYTLLICFERNKTKTRKNDSIFYDQQVTDLFSKQYVEDLETELKNTKQELQNTIEELETSNEELQSSNEELHASNEELQTMNDELQKSNKDLREAKQKIEKNEYHLLQAQKIARMGSWYLDIRTNEVEWTEELYKMYGFDPAKPPPPYTEHMKLFTPESWELLSSALAKTREKGVPYELELNTVRKDGSKGWMWVRGEAIFDKNREIIGLWGAAQDISDKKQNEINLLQAKLQAEQNEKQFRQLFENMEQGFALHKMIYNDKKEPVDYQFILVNEAFEKQTKLKAKDLLGKTVLEVLPDTEQYWIKTYGKVAKTGKGIQFQNYSSALGKHFSVSVYSPKKDYFATIFDDITEQKRIIAEIENAKNLNDTLTEKSPYGIMLFNSDGDCILANENAGKLMNGTKEKLMQQNIHHINEWKKGCLYRDAIKTIKTGEQTLNIEKVKTPFGITIWMEYAFARFIYNDNPHLVLQFQDVGDRVKNQEALIESENRYRNMFYENQSVMLLIDPIDGRIVDANAAATNYYGYNPDELKAMNISDINILSDDQVKEEMKKALNNNVRFFQFKHRLSDGSIRNVQVYSGKINIAGKPLLYSIVHDNTAEIEAVEKLKKQTAQLIQAEKMNAIGTLTAGVAHELNNPLMGILNYAEYCKENIPTDNKVYSVLNDLIDEAERSAEIVKSLLSFTRKESDDTKINFKTEIIKGINDCLKILRLKASSKNVSINLEVEEDKIYGNIKPSYLQQIIFNLVDNAIFSVSESPRKEIKIRVIENTEFLLIKITDTGKGISEENMNMIFDPFFTTKPVGKGTGLGLSIIKNLVEESHGTIMCESKTDEGTTFEITIPKHKHEQLI